MVGCGPAGASAARAAAQRGLSVMVVDRRRSVGMPPRCSGYVPKWLRRYTCYDDGAVLQEVSGIRHHDADGQCVELRVPGHVLDRSRFDKTLAIQALEAGADLANACVLSREGGRVVVRRGGREGVFEGRFVVGADGPASVVGRSIGVEGRQFLATLQYEVGLKEPAAWCEFYAAMAGEGCPAWFVPCGRTARVGVGVPKARAGTLKMHLQTLLCRLGDEDLVHADAVLESTGGLVPSDRWPGPLQAGPVVLAGAAGGISQPFAGCGIAAAVASGLMAGDLIAGAVLGCATDDYGAAIGDLCGEGRRSPVQDPSQIRPFLTRLADWFSTRHVPDVKFGLAEPADAQPRSIRSHG